MELSGSKQIPKLAVTADHSRNPGQLCCRDQHQIRVEIERMSHRNAKFPQAAGQLPAASQRCQAIEAPTQRRLMEFTYALQKGSLPLQTTKMHSRAGVPQRLRYLDELTLCATRLQAVYHEED